MSGKILLIMSNPCRVWITNLNRPSQQDLQRCNNQARRACRDSLTGVSSYSFFTTCLYQVEVSRATTGPVCVITKNCVGMLYGCTGFMGAIGNIFTCS